MEVGGRVLRETASRRAAAVETERGPIKKDKKQRSEKEKEKNLKNEFSSLVGKGIPPAVVQPLQTKLLEKDAGECTAPAPYRVPFRNLFSKSFEQKKNVIEKIDRKNLSEVKLSGQVSELKKNFVMENQKIL